MKYTTADGDGTFTSNTPIFLPSSGGVTVFAYYPYDESGNISAYSIKSEEQVDLLSATKEIEEISTSSSTVDLSFNHLLSKVSLTIKAGDGLTSTDLDNLTVELSGISTEATFDLTKSESEVTTTNSNKKLALATIITKGDDSGEITYVSSSAIVIPQELNDATILFSTDSYGTFSAMLSAKEFKAGKEHTYTATLNRNGIEITEANIDGWGDGGETTGSANIVDIEYKKDNDKYSINSAKGLAAFRDLVNGSGNTQSASFAGFESSAFESPNSDIDGVLTANIDLSDVCGTSWDPIGNSRSLYNGTFDGGGYLVSGIMITNGDSAGLFGWNSGTISNIGVSGTINGLEVMASGGVAAYNYGIINHCYNMANIYTTDISGGIVAYNVGTITECYNTAGISGDNSVGGVVGENNGTITNCYNTGSVTGRMVGGIARYNFSGNITNCFSTGSLTGNYSAYGIVNINDSEGTVINCYWDSNIFNGEGVANYDSNSTIIVTGMHTDEMQTSDFVTTLNNGAYTYNAANTSASQACAWIDNSPGGYPTLNFDEKPIYTNIYWELSEFSSTNYPDGNIWYISDREADDSELFLGLKDALATANGGKEITIEFSNLTSLPTEAFSHCIYLSSISLPSATEIGEYAFSLCSNLFSISLPLAKKIGDNAFDSCTMLTSISLPSATDLGTDLFFNCTNLTSLDLGSAGSGISSLGYFTFHEVVTNNIYLTIKIADGATGILASNNTLTFNGNSATFALINVITD